jgi:hypothetical protein
MSVEEGLSGEDLDGDGGMEVRGRWGSRRLGRRGGRCGRGGVEADVVGSRGSRPGEAVGEATTMQAWRHAVEEREHGWRRKDSS